MTTTADIPDQSTALDITAILKRAAAEKLGLSSFLALLYLHDLRQRIAELSVSLEGHRRILATF